MKDVMEHFVNNFNLHALKMNKNIKHVEGNEKTLLEKGVLMIVISNEEKEETYELETPIVRSTWEREGHCQGKWPQHHHHANICL